MPQRNTFDTQEEFESALRDYFAAKAMVAIMRVDEVSLPDWDQSDSKSIAERAYTIADAMIAARKEGWLGR